MISAHCDEAVYIIGNDIAATASMERLFTSIKIEPRIFGSPIDFLRSFSPEIPCCLIMEMRMPKLTGLELLAQLQQQAVRAPAIVATAYGDVTSAVRAMKLGAVEFMEKPVNEELLVEYVQHWIGIHRNEMKTLKRQTAIKQRLAKLSPRERDVLRGLLNGKSNKEIARELGITPKAIELYRSKLMTKMQASSLVALIRDTLCCSAIETHQCPSLNECGDSTHFCSAANLSENIQIASERLIETSQYFSKQKIYCGDILYKNS